MPQNITKGDVNVGKAIYQWKVKEYEQQERNRRWYLVMGTAGIALVVYGLISGNYLFALIIILFGIVLFLHDMIEPQAVPFVITETGIVLGRNFYRYSELSNFWLIYNPPAVKSLYFKLNSLIKHRLQIPLLDNDPRPIREYLSQFVTEDLEQEEEPLSDRIGRMFRL